tara:strand:+ start:29 stop:979 length:951 start_codon:yes stop_codon:yes gene_type:complete
MNAILYCNAIPVFADIDPDTFLIDPKSIKEKITSRTKAIMPVHLYGQVCDMTEIMKIAKEHNLYVLEDCAQCYLGTHKGKLGGTIGDVGSWSFENSKHITTGDGGIVTCKDELLGDKLRKAGSQGFRNATAVSGKVRTSKALFQNPEFKRHDELGFMYRLPEVAAAMGLAQIEKLEWFVDKRIQMHEMYKEAISGCNWMVPQFTPEGDINSAYAFAVKMINDDIKWSDFREKYIENGGDGIYAAWSLCYNEDSIPEIKEILSSMGLEKKFLTDNGQCPSAEKVQKEIMQFTTNQKDKFEMEKEAECLYKTVRFFGL